MARTPRMYVRVPMQRYTASTFYRMALPIYWARKLNLPIEFAVDCLYTDLTPEQRWMVMMGSDMNLIYQSVGYEFHNLMRESRGWEGKPGADGEMRYPPTFIFDTDDDILSVLPMNDAYKDLGYKDHNGNVLADGSKVWVKNGVTGEPQLLWSDGENIDLARNRSQAEGWIATMKEADLITCTTPKCRDYVLREGVDPKKVHVFPNCISFDDYPPFAELADHPNEVRILWQGSPAHREDLWPYREAFGNVAKKYPHTTWYFWGAPFDWITTYIPPERAHILPWVHHMEYHARLSLINHDISLALLSPYIFNQSRSAIKFYEACAIHKPAASLCQRTGEYPDVIIEGETGMLFSTPEEFEQKLSELIENETLRKTLASNGKQWVREHRDPAVHVPVLFDRWMQAWEERKQRPVEPPINADPLPKHKPHVRRSKKPSNRKRKRSR